MEIEGNIEFTVTERTDDYVLGEMPVQPGILNPFGHTHAAAMLWLADVCATVLAHSSTEIVPGAAGFPLLVQMSASVVGNQKDGVIKARSEFVKRGRRLQVVRTIVTGDGDRTLVDVTTSHIPA